MFRWKLDKSPLWGEMSRLQREMDELFNVISRTRRPIRTPLWGEARLFPLLNVTETEDAFVVTAEIPGMKTEDLEIKIEGDTLTLKGERKPHEIPETASFHRRERATGTFQRSLTLHKPVDPENVKATYKDGVLTVSLTKQKPTTPKQIEIKAD